MLSHSSDRLGTSSLGESRYGAESGYTADSYNIVFVKLTLSGGDTEILPDENLWAHVFVV